MTKHADTTSGVPARLAPHRAQRDIVSAVEAERHRLATQLQDNAIQPLTLLLSQTTAYERSLSDNPSARMALSVLSSLAQQVLYRLRDLETSLNPTVLKALGLEPALEALAGHATRAHGVKVQIVVERLPERLPAQLELALYRAAQDVLERAVASAHASQLLVRLEQRDEALLFSISDNGTASRAAPDHDAAVGPAKQRLEALGANVDLGTGPLGGLEFRVNLAAALAAHLTPREKEVVALLVEGLSNKEIAAALGISTRTVSFHLDNIYTKLGVGSRTEAAIYALRHGWGR